MAPLVVICNPVSGGGSLTRLKELEECLAEEGLEYTTFVTEKAGDAERKAKQCAEGKTPVGALVVIGGDGTLNEAINGLGSSAIPLALVPSGTANVLAKEVGLDLLGIQGIVALIARGTPRPVHLGKAIQEGKERRFLLMAGIGFDAEAVFNVSAPLKKATGKFAYVASGLKTFFFSKASLVRLVAEGKEYRCSAAILSNIRCYGGRFLIAPDADIEEEGFDLFLTTGESKATLLRAFLSILFNTAPRDKRIIRLKTKEVEIVSPSPVQLDGDYFGESPLKFVSAGKGLSLFF